jgi:hypothetical protein
MVNWMARGTVYAGRAGGWIVQDLIAQVTFVLQLRRFQNRSRRCDTSSHA